MRHFFILLLITFNLTICLSQEDAVLFYIEDNPVTVSEFKYIYEKNNRDKANYSKESIEEYLNLYINFKLKVQKAREKGYHESDAYKRELAGYRNQLADSYIIDREVINRIANQIYERSKTDVALRHILVPVPQNAGDEVINVAEEKIHTAHEAIKSGLTFEEAVVRHSLDVNSIPLGGDIGFISAPLPDGFVELENLAYSLNVGAISPPVWTELGFHIIQIVDKRQARGEIEAQHLLIRKMKNGIRLADAFPRAKRIYEQIKTGSISFKDATSKFSEDSDTKGKGGNLGTFGIGQYEMAFEDAAFALDSDGAISEPVETSIGWHIIRRVSKKKPDSVEIIYERLKSRPKQGERFEMIRDDVVEGIKKEAQFSEDLNVLESFTQKLDDVFLTYNWKSGVYTNQQLISFGNENFSIDDFAKFAEKNNRERLRAKGNQSIEDTVQELYNMFVNAKAISFAEARLEDKYPEFKNLMREYREGILLFDITKDMVWDKAASDTTGVRRFFDVYKDNYQWKDRAVITNYTLRTLNAVLVTSVLNASRKENPEALSKSYNQENELIIYKQETLEADHKSLEGINLVEGSITSPKFNNNLKVTTFKKVEKVIPARPKTLREARGYVISDYQDQLDKEWIAELKNDYKVAIQKKALKRLIK